jgi:hypothetical protein
MILLGAGGSAGELVSKLGLSFIVAGIVSTFHEGVLRRLEGGENARTIADEIHNRLKSVPLFPVGIRLVSSIRKGYAGYYLWAVDNSPEEMFFAGRSVLHRIDADFRARAIGTAESVIVRRLTEGARIKVSFLDPRSEMIERLAREEGQTAKQLLSDIATSLGICARLHRLLALQPLPPNASLEIRVFDEIPYFAYHNVGEHIIVGFYFSSTLGHSSAAYEVVDLQTRQFFAEHFRSIFSRASDKYVVRTNPHVWGGNPEFNLPLIAELRKPIVEAIGEAEANRLMSDRVSPN